MPRKTEKIHQNIYYNYFHVLILQLFFCVSKIVKEGVSVGGFKDC